MSNQDKLAVRVSRPQTIAAAFGGLMQKLGGRASDADLLTNWENIVEKDVYKISKIVAVRKDKSGKLTITLRPINPAFALELSYKTNDIIKAVNNYYKNDTVSKIVIRK